MGNGENYIDSKKKGNILRKTKRRKANWIGHILRRNCFLDHVTDGKIEERVEAMGRRGTRRKQLRSGLKETTGYWKLK